MKQGIFVALAALALAIVSVPDTTAKAWGWHNPNLNLKLAGSAFSASVDDDGVLTSFQNGIATGKYVRALITGQTEAQPAAPIDGCDLVGGGIVFNFVLTFRDGSLLSGTSAPGSIYCSDGLTLSVDLGGVITGGDKRFEGATGTFHVVAASTNGRATGRLNVDLD